MFTRHSLPECAARALLAAAALAAFLLAVAWAQPELAQAAGGDDPPPRPTRTPTPTPEPTATPWVHPTARPRPEQDIRPGAGLAAIELTVRLAPGASAEPATVWTAVEWQDSGGRWHPVDGWQGTLEGVQPRQGTKRWVVDGSLLGRGPFRWTVLDAPGGRRLATSPEFDLPGQAGETVSVEVAIER